MSWFSWWRNLRKASPAEPVAPVSIPVRGRAGISPEQGPYALPNDLGEAKRLDLQHYILRQVLQSNTVAPISNPSRVLDTGCGTGRWAIEIARQFPQAEVVGVDIVAPERAYADDDLVPANYAFQVGNIVEGLPFDDASFDYVHQRFLTFGIPTAKWQSVVNELARLTAPGGWVESVEATLPTGGGPAFMQLSGAFGEVSAARGSNASRVPHIDAMMRQSQPALEQVQSRQIAVPVGVHGGKIGNYMAWEILSGMRNFGPYLIQAGTFTREQWESLIQQADEELNNPAIHTHLPIYLVIGVRPE